MTKAIASEDLKSDVDVDTLLYIVNFEDGGFSVLSADKRLSEPVLIIAEDGELSIEDFLFDYSLETTYTDEQDTTEFKFYNPIDDDYYVAASDDGGRPGRIIAEITSRFVYHELIMIDGDKRPNGWFDGGGSGGNEPVTFKWVTDKNNYKLEMMSTKWSQGEPFNDLCPVRGVFEKKRAPAGCVPVALGQIMAYHEYPQNIAYNDVLCEYGVMKSFSSNNSDSQLPKIMLAHFMRFIGDMCNVDYHKEYAFATPAAAKRCLEKFGYSHVVKTMGYDCDVIVESLKNDNPVFIAAISGLINGHAWVIDGYLKQNYLSSNGAFYGSRTLLHCNMGWGGLCNGYYASGIFDVKNGIVIPDEKESEEAPKYNFDWWYRILTYDNPK